MRRERTDQLGEVPQLSQLLRQGNQLVVAGDQNLQREAADDGGQHRQLVPTEGRGIKRGAGSQTQASSCHR